MVVVYAYGWPACSYSCDGGHTWSEPRYMTYLPDGRQRVKNPRAANFVWKCSNGKFLYWFHNHGGVFIDRMKVGLTGTTASPGSGGSPYDDRNPAWLMAGREVDTPNGRFIEWSQPEIVLYDDDPYIRMSYPDLIQEDGKYYLTETQKNVARLHEVSPLLIDGLFSQWDHHDVAMDGLLLEVPATNSADAPAVPESVNLPTLPRFNMRDTLRRDYGVKDLRAGFSIDVWLQPELTTGERTLLDSRDSSDRGMMLKAIGKGTLSFMFSDGRQTAVWNSDADVLTDSGPQHVVITVDGGPKIITFVVNGILCDGGDQRQFGWGRFSRDLRTPDGAPEMKLDPAVKKLRLYGRALRTSEAVGNFRAGLAP